MLPESHQCPNGCRRLCCIDARAGGRNAKVWPRYQAPRSLKCGCPPGWKKASTGFSRYVLQTVLKKTFYRLFYMSLKLTLMRRFRGPKKDHHARLRIVHPPGGWRPSALRGSGTFWPMAPLHLWSMTQSLFACPEQQKLLHPGALRLLHMFQTLDSGQARTCLLYTSPSPRDQRGSRMPSSA